MSTCIQAARLHRPRLHRYIPSRYISHTTRLASLKVSALAQKYETQPSKELEQRLQKTSPTADSLKPNRPRILEDLARRLVRQKRYGDAAGVYKRMLDEGFHPSPYVTLSIGVIISVLSASQPPEQVLSVTVPVVSDPSFDEQTLRELVDLFHEHGFGPNFIDSVVAHFVASRGVDYFPSYQLRGQLVSIHRQANTLRSAERWLNIDTEMDPIKEDSHPFAAFLAGSGDMEGSLSRMKSYGIPPDTSIFNAMIGIQIRHRAYNKAFELYRLLKKADLTPDATTYASLFTAQHKLNHLQNNAPRSRLHPIPPNKLETRALYKDMLLYHFSATDNRPTKPSLLVSSRVLSICLRAFLSKRDYPGAFVALRGFFVCGLVPTYDTYTMVVKQLALHSSPPLPKIFDLGDGLEARLRDDKEYGLYFENSELPEEFTLGVLPLQRLLRRKMLDDLEAEGTDNPIQALKELLQATKAEMVPALAQEAKQVRRGRRNLKRN